MAFAIRRHESARRAHVSPYPEPPPPTSLPTPCLGLSQSTGSQSPASCMELALVIYFTHGNAHASVSFSHIIPPSPSPRVQNLPLDNHKLAKKKRDSLIHVSSDIHLAVVKFQN